MIGGPLDTTARDVRSNTKFVGGPLHGQMIPSEARSLPETLFVRMTGRGFANFAYMFLVGGRRTGDTDGEAEYIACNQNYDPNRVWVYAIRGHEYVLQGEGGDPSMADIIQPVRPIDPATGEAERNLPHTSPDASDAPQPVVTEAEPAGKPVDPTETPLPEGEGKPATFSTPDAPASPEVQPPPPNTE